MRGARSKAYRKLMRQFAITFNFREPYQVLLDSQIIQDSAKIDLVAALERTLQGKVKPMITQCDMRHLYQAQPKDEALINQAKTYERRRCNHHELEEPLSSLECLSEVVGPTNKHRYIVASQVPELRAHMRRIPGVPLVYINRSVMILEPMASSSEEVRNGEEKAKFRAGLKGRRGANTSAGEKRKRDDDKEEDGEESNSRTTAQGQSTGGDDRPEKKKRAKGPKGPNPLSVKKPKKQQPPASEKPKRSSDTQEHAPDTTSKTHEPGAEPGAQLEVDSNEVVDGERAGKQKRKRKHKPKGTSGSNENAEQETAV
ncbi:hypothetical protein GQ43DRAFT_389414 [Delitschia confertaspora ATCC 74209]|uniref:U three protein 23 n=1 Tax=Delitschia confertaspora ATCC 74209 TaxID=1513339 RepID=A0A9P4MV62_9PLEO|nr:hypothetical protein GQ43DRAFT_389414 [Delitschia confertaspora ATCC 74209]